MTATQLLPLIGLLSQAVLALLFAIVWRALRRHWALFLAFGFAANAAMYVAMLASAMRTGLAEPPDTLVALLSVLAVVLITAAVIHYVGTDARWSRRLNVLSAGVATLAVALGLSGFVSRGAGLALLALYVSAWAVLFVGAARREPRSGHVLVIVALLAYPATLALAMLGWVRSEMLAGIGVLPYSMLGATLLTTGLLRAQRQAAHALAERERAQAQLRAAHDGLEHEVALRTAGLRQIIDGLESFNRSVSHDLRGPLGGIVGVARLGREALAAGDAVQARRLFDLIESQASHSVRLVEALLALARASDSTLNLRAADSGRIVADVIAALAAGAAPAPAIRVVSGMPTVQADPELLRQVFANLIGNALKFAAPGRAVRVEVDAVRSDGELVFRVRDNGIGFDPAVGHDLFKPFHRLHHGAYEGSGVGLSIVKRIVDRHGGRIWAEGRPDEGATFCFTLGPAPTSN